MLPSADILREFEHGKFVLSNLAAKRAKQLRDGAPPLVRIESNHPLTIALAEIAAGKIKAVMPSEIDAAVEGADIRLLDDLPAELGMLLPALDETEVALVSPASLGEDEVDHETDADDAESLSLSDLAGDDEEEEEPETSSDSDDDSVSLTDIAEQEESAEDEDSDES